MNNELTIGVLAKRSGVPTKTIRFYESIGLIRSPDRLSNGYRSYPESRVEELILIKDVRDLGLPIPQIKRLMMGCPNGDCSHSGEYIDKEISEYLEVLGKKIKEMTNLRAKLHALRTNLAECSGNHEGKYCCNVLGQIAQLSKGGEKE